MRFLLSEKSRKKVFDFLKKEHNVGNFRELSEKMNIPYKTIKNWRYEYKKYIPDFLTKNYPYKLEILDKQPDNWGQIKAGKIGGKKSIEKLKKLWGKEEYIKIKKEIGKNNMKKLQKKYGIYKLSKMAVMGRLKNRKEESIRLEKNHKELFINKRILLNLRGIKLNKYDKIRGIKFPLEMSPELAEEIGIHLGDGCLSFNRKYFSVKTNKKEEDYMVNFLFPLYKKLYNINLKLMRLSSVVGFEVYSRALFDFKNRVLEIPYGNKVEKIEVPKVILESKNKDIYRAFIRGLFDTDGCVNIIKTKKNYPVVTFTIKSERLISQVGEMLIKLGFIPRIGKWKIDLNGHLMVNKWFKEIGSNNSKNLIRLKQASSSIRTE